LVEGRQRAVLDRLGNLSVPSADILERAVRP